MPERHAAKKQTPTMGGAVILISTIIPTLLWSDLRNEYIWLVTTILVTFGIIGYLDDIRKLRGVTTREGPGEDETHSRNRLVPLW